MKTVHTQMPPFKHEFYAIAIKAEGTGSVSTGNYQANSPTATLFFNSPYQIQTWEIMRDWKGYYIIFTEDFYRQPGYNHRITELFPFLLVDNTIPMALDEHETARFLHTFTDIFEEFHAEAPHSREVIRSYVQILLHKVARLFEKEAWDRIITQTQRDNDVQLVSRFNSLIEESFRQHEDSGRHEPHQVQYYADRLNLHPNHLNAIVKRITSHSASDCIQRHILSLAQAKLRHTAKTVKEIAYELHYTYPNHFTSFFRKQTGLTPVQYRKSVEI